VPEDKTTSILHVIERRTESRILVHMPVEVTEVDGDGQPFVDRTFIEDVSDFGCRFSTCGPVKKGDTVAVKILGRYGNNLADEKAHLYEIMWVAVKDRGSTVGARLLEGEKLAKADFPGRKDREKDEPK
jgi:PilZ domain-containing protein